MLINLNEQHQFLTSLPNDNSKKIDYIIKYKQQTSAEHKFKIDAFFNDIKNKVSQIEIVHLNVDKNDNKKYTYALLHFPLDRLLDEAETIKLELNLKQVQKKKDLFLFRCIFKLTLN